MAGIVLVKLVEDWLKAEGLTTDFSISRPRMNDTIMAGYEGSIKYDHHSEGYATVVSIYETHVYIDYDEVNIEASDPKFFDKLKDVLLRHKKIHENCNHIRNIND